MTNPNLAYVDGQLLLVDRRLGVSQSDAENESSGVRLYAIHVRGVDEMSTQDVFDYFAQFAPTAVEWIDDSSCTSCYLCLSVCLSVCLSACLPVTVCLSVCLSVIVCLFVCLPACL